MTDAYKYDAAISFLSEDEPVARELYELLAKSMSVFFFPENQREVIGLDGTKVFTEVFRRQSRVVVVIHRERWGDTDWTAVESHAIADLYLHRQVDRILIHSLDGSHPEWDFEARISSRNSLSDLAAAVADRVRKFGGEVIEEDVVAKAQRLRRSLEVAKRREEQRFSPEAVEKMRSEVAAVAEHLRVLTGRIRGAVDSAPVFQQIGGIATVHADHVSVGFWWHGAAMNSIRGAKLTLLLSNGPLSAHGWREDTSREMEDFELYPTDDEATWIWVGSKGQSLSSEAVANRALHLLLDEQESRTKSYREKLARRLD